MSAAGENHGKQRQVISGAQALGGDASRIDPSAKLAERIDKLER